MFVTFWSADLTNSQSLLPYFLSFAQVIRSRFNEFRDYTHSASIRCSFLISYFSISRCLAALPLVCSPPLPVLFLTCPYGYARGLVFRVTRSNYLPELTFVAAGLFAYSHMDFDVDRNTNDTGDPSLAEMTIKALRILAKNPEGYFLFVEGKSEVTTPGKEPLTTLWQSESGSVARYISGGASTLAARFKTFRLLRGQRELVCLRVHCAATVHTRMTVYKCINPRRSTGREVENNIRAEISRARREICQVDFSPTTRSYCSRNSRCNREELALLRSLLSSR